MSSNVDNIPAVAYNKDEIIWKNKSDTSKLMVKSVNYYNLEHTCDTCLQASDYELCVLKKKEVNSETHEVAYREISTTVYACDNCIHLFYTKQ